MVMQFGQFLDHDMSLIPELEEHCRDTATATRDSQKPTDQRSCFNVDISNDIFYKDKLKCFAFTKIRRFMHKWKARAVQQTDFNSNNTLAASAVLSLTDFVLATCPQLSLPVFPSSAPGGVLLSRQTPDPDRAGAR